jgi:outer membrane protein
MKFKSTLLVTVMLCSLISSTRAQWSLEDCINYAHANNLQVKRAELQAGIAENNYFQSKMNVLPDLNAGMSRTYAFGRQVNQFTNEFLQNNTVNDNLGIEANLNIFNGFQTYNGIKRNEFAVLASLQNVEREKIEITFNIATDYLNILFSEELLGVAKSQLEVTSQQVDRTSKLVQAGSLAKGDLLEIEAQRASESLNLTNAQNNVNLAYLNLTQLLDLDSTGGFSIVMPDTVQINPDAPVISAVKVYSEASTSLPHVKSAEFNLQSNAYNLAVQKGRRSPQLYARTAWGTGYSSEFRDTLGVTFGYGRQFDGNMNTSVSVGLRVPIFNNWNTNNAISNAKINVFDAEYSLDLVKQQLYKNIQQAHNDAVSARDKYQSAIHAVESYRESFHYTEQKFNVGIVNSVEYNIAKNNFIKAESEMLQAKYEYIFAIKILDFYRGIPLSLQNLNY